MRTAGQVDFVRYSGLDKSQKGLRERRFDGALAGCKARQNDGRGNRCS